MFYRLINDASGNRVLQQIGEDGIFELAVTDTMKYLPEGEYDEESLHQELMKLGKGKVYG